MATAPSELADLQTEVEYLRRMLTVVEAARWLDRFHSFDAIKDDACPACGGRVVIEDNGFHSGVRLKAVQ